MAKTKVTAATILGRITYTSIYVFLCFILAILLLIVPADFVRQVLFHTFQRTNVLILTIVYVLTLLVVLFVYALRLYTNRTVLASIPSLWIPVEKGDVNKEVRAMIVASLGRSAAVAWEARPRPKIASPIEVDGGLDIILEGTNETAVEAFGTNDRYERDQEKETGRKGIFDCLGRKQNKKPPTTVEDEMGITLPPVRPVWGQIDHDGWESPDSPDLPNLQYATVLAELPNLIEAKAVSLAPPDFQQQSPTAISANYSPPAAAASVLDPEAVALLQRAANMSMRHYVTHLVGLRMLPSDALEEGGHIASEFLDAYERARFSTKPMSKVLFRNLMRLFAELLRVMRSPDPAVLYGDVDAGSDDGFEEDEDGYSARRLYGGHGDGVSVTDSSDGHIDDDAPRERDGTPTTPTRSLNLSFSDSLRSGSGSGSVIYGGGGDANSLRSNASSSNSRQRRQSQRQPRPPTREHSQHLLDQHIRDRDRTSSSTNTWQQQQRYRTAPTTPMSRQVFGGNSNGNDAASHRSVSSESVDTFARTRRPYPGTSSSSSSSSISGGASLRSFSSGRSRATGVSRSGSQGSQQGSVIIRLARPEDRDEISRGLPFVLRMGGGER